MERVCGVESWMSTFNSHALPRLFSIRICSSISNARLSIVQEMMDIVINMLNTPSHNTLSAGNIFYKGAIRALLYAI